MLFRSTHIAGSFALPEEDSGSFPPVRRVVPNYDKLEGGRTPNGATRVSMSSFYLGAANQVLSAFMGHSPTNARHATAHSVRVYTGKDWSDPILVKPSGIASDLDGAICGSEMSIVVMPVKDD